MTEVGRGVSNASVDLTCAVLNGMLMEIKKDSTPKSVKVMIGGKYYKAKKDEWSYDSEKKLISFKGDNLAGSYTVR